MSWNLHRTIHLIKRILNHTHMSCFGQRLQLSHNCTLGDSKCLPMTSDWAWTYIARFVSSRGFEIIPICLGFVSCGICHAIVLWETFWVTVGDTDFSIKNNYFSHHQHTKTFHLVTFWANFRWKIIMTSKYTTLWGH